LFSYDLCHIASQPSRIYPIWANAINYHQRAQLRSVYYKQIRLILRDFRFNLGRKELSIKLGVQSFDHILFRRMSVFVFGILQSLFPVIWWENYCLVPTITLDKRKDYSFLGNPELLRSDHISHLWHTRLYLSGCSTTSIWTNCPLRRSLIRQHKKWIEHFSIYHCNITVYQKLKTFKIKNLSFHIYIHNLIDLQDNQS